jgi:RsiW-degrading membrane proteinase PrsW (M82 family)
MDVFALIASILVALVYIRFLRQMDVFEKETWINTFLCFLIGVVTVPLAFVIYIIFPDIINLPESGNFSVRLRYHMQGVASVEELVKIIPFLIFYNRKHVLNESYDFIKYASLGAMGFAAFENVLYFKSDISIIQDRAFYTAVLHMFTSSIIAYSIFYFKKNSKLPFLLILVVAYGFAVFTHGLFNALVSSQSTFYFAVFQVIFMLILWGKMMNNALNHSEYFHEKSIQLEISKAGIQLLIGWGGIFTYAVVAVYFQDGMTVAIEFIKESFLFGIISGAGLYYFLARPRIKKGIWIPLFKKIIEMP